MATNRAAEEGGGKAAYGPPVVHETEMENDRKTVGNEAKELLARKAYDQIERRAQELRASRANYPDGYWRLGAFYSGLNMAKPGSWVGDAEQEAHIAVLRAWVRERSNSVTARIALARSLWDYGSLGRLQQFSGRSLNFEDLAALSKRLAEAQAVLDSAKGLTNKCPLWYGAALRIAGRQRRGAAVLRQMFQEAIKAEPAYEDYYFVTAYYLTPIKGIRLREMEEFMEEAANGKGGEEGDMLYAKMAWGLHDWEPRGNFYRQSSISWDRVKRGFEGLLNRYPHCLDVASEFCYQACQAGDRPTARHLFEEEVKDQVVLRTWETPERFEQFRRYYGP